VSCGTPKRIREQNFQQSPPKFKNIIQLKRPHHAAQLIMLLRRPVIRKCPVRRPGWPRAPQRNLSSPSPLADTHPLSKTQQYIEFDSTFSPEQRLESLRDFALFPNFISQAQHDNLVTEIDTVLKKKRYQSNHWDNVITGYKETEKANWVSRRSVLLCSRLKSLFQTPENMKTLQQVRSVFDPRCEWLPAVHVIDLEGQGPIDAHTDTREVRLN